MTRFLVIVTPDELLRLALPDAGAFVIGAGGRSSICLRDQQLAVEHAELLVDTAVSLRLMHPAVGVDAGGARAPLAVGREHALEPGSTVEIGALVLSVVHVEDVEAGAPRALSIDALLSLALASPQRGGLYRMVAAPAVAIAYARHADELLVWSDAAPSGATAVERPSAAVEAALARVWPPRAAARADTSPAAPDDDDAPRGSLRDELAALERKRILEALRTHKTQKEAAAALDMPMRTFVNRLDALGISRARGGGRRED